VNRSAAGAVRVRVPATTANLGPGFDCLALALDLWNEAAVSVTDAGVLVTASGRGSERLASGADNLIARAVNLVAERAGLPAPPGLRIDCVVRVPLSSGLGSSASAVVAGLLAGNALLGSPLDDDALLELAAEMEGHPDNVAAALRGGLVIVVRHGDGLLARRIDMLAPLSVALAVPDVDVSTTRARAGLPLEIPMSDAVYNLGRAPLVVEGLRTGDLGLLGLVMDDRLHQATRLKLVPGGDAALAAGLAAGAAAVAVSGAGPSLIGFCRGERDSGAVAAAMVAAFAGAGVAARPLSLRATPAAAEIVA
jgi:homoserine kinase